MSLNETQQNIKSKLKQKLHWSNTKIPFLYIFQLNVTVNWLYLLILIHYRRNCWRTEWINTLLITMGRSKIRLLHPKILFICKCERWGRHPPGNAFITSTNGKSFSSRQWKRVSGTPDDQRPCEEGVLLPRQWWHHDVGHPGQRRRAEATKNKQKEEGIVKVKPREKSKSKNVSSIWLKLGCKKRFYQKQINVLCLRYILHLLFLFTLGFLCFC